MKNIIVPTDFSPNAFHAALVAYALGSQHGARITLIHCYRPVQSAFQPGKANEDDTVRIRNDAERQMAELQDKLVDVNLDTSLMQFVCAPGDLTSVLYELGRQVRIGLVVMGTTGASGLKYHFLGSHTFDVARQGKFPLLVVPIGVQHFTIENIAFLTDFEPKDRVTLAQLVKIFGEKDMRYQLVHIYDDVSDVDQGQDPAVQAATQKLESWGEQLRDATGLGTLSTRLVVDQESLQAVNNLAAQQDIDLLALTMVERSFWELLGKKNMAKTIIMQSKVPVFITP